MTTTHVSPAAGSDLASYARIAWRRRWWVAGIAVLATALGLALSTVRPEVWSSSATVLVRPVPGADPGSSRGEQIVDLETERQVMRSVVVAQSALAALQADEVAAGLTPQQLLDRIDVEVPADTRVLVATATAEGPAEAQRFAQAQADAYLGLRRTQAKTAIDQQVTSLDAQLATAEAELRSVNETLATVSSTSPEGIEAQTRRDVLTRQVSDLQDRRGQLAAAPLDVGQVLSPAALPTTPAGSSRVRDGAIALAAGLVLGLAVAFVRDRFDDGLRNPDEVEGSLGVPLLAEIPALDAGKADKKGAALVALADPDGPEADSFRRLRSNLLMASPEAEVKTLLVTSARSGEGKSTVAANLAVSLAQSGRSVVLVSADLRRPSLERLFDLSNDRGLTGVLQGTDPLQAVLFGPIDADLAVLPSGPAARRSGDLLQSTAMAELLANLRASFDFVIIDTPPVLAVADTLGLAPMADAALLVVLASEIAGQQVVEAANRLEQAGIHVLGTVLNRTRPKVLDAAYYGRPRAGSAAR